jgi:hypothetical protein
MREIRRSAPPTSSVSSRQLRKPPSHREIGVAAYGLVELAGTEADIQSGVLAEGRLGEKERAPAASRKAAPKRPVDSRPVLR